MLTVFLKHDQSRPLSALKAQLAKQEFHTVFPPAGVEVVSWNITMGIGQVIVLRLAEVTLARAARGSGPSDEFLEATRTKLLPVKNSEATVDSRATTPA